MDIRNITEPTPVLGDPELYLYHIYELGKEQLAGYSKIEDIPQDFPLDINTAKSQVILKDFIGRVIEEFTEGFESQLKISEIMTPVGWNIRRIDGETYAQVLNHLQNANEEQADAIGFYITLLLYSNILPDDFFSYYEEMEEAKASNKTLDFLMSYGVSLLYKLCPDINFQAVGFTLFNQPILNSFDYENANFDTIKSYTPGFNAISPTTLVIQSTILWWVIYYLNQARNLLKNRPWKQSQEMTKELDYQEALVKSFLLYLGYLAYTGFNQESLFELFFKKQRLNLWRQRTGY